MGEVWSADLVLLDWTPLRQTITAHRPGEGQIGDCFRTAIACLLGAPDPTCVPHFVEQNPGGSGFDDRAAARKWLRENFAMDMMTVNLEAAIGYGVPFMVTVKSKRGPWNHLVIAIGDKVVHDPSGRDDYTLADADADDATAEVICTMYDPDPDEMVRIWVAARESAEATEMAAHGH